MINVIVLNCLQYNIQRIAWGPCIRRLNLLLAGTYLPYPNNLPVTMELSST